MSVSTLMQKRVHLRPKEQYHHILTPVGGSVMRGGCFYKHVPASSMTLGGAAVVSQS